LIDSSESGYRKHKTANLGEIEGRKGEPRRESVQGQSRIPERKTGIEKETILRQGGKTRGKNRSAVSLI
jgi:hypothetical protein